MRYYAVAYVLCSARQLAGLSRALLKRIAHEKLRLAEFHETRASQSLLLMEGRHLLHRMQHQQEEATLPFPTSARFSDDLVPLFHSDVEPLVPVPVMAPAINRLMGLSYWYDLSRQELTVRMTFRGPHRYESNRWLGI